jgi:hypothetical protein
MLAVWLAACGKPVPADKSAYVGRWEGPGMALSISADGHVDYKRVKGATSSSISAPLQGFHGDSFDVGLGPMSTTFKVTSPPHQDGGATKMTVDGVELVKAP